MVRETFGVGSDMSLETAAIAANRFGLGARPGELKAIAGDPRGWLKAQLTPETAPPPTLAALPSTAEASGAFGKWILTLGITPGADRQELMKLYGDATKPAAPSGSEQKLSVEQSYIKTFGPGYEAAVGARFRQAATTERPFHERLVRFWSNHFTVSAAKPEIIALAPVFERDVVRPRVCGKFEDMLLASCRHPGMLEYLDNHISIGPNSPLAHNPQYLPAFLRERMKGLNENLGREILELHTLGVRSGYSQADVTNLAKIITGWMLLRPGDQPTNNDRFRYVDFAHEPGPQTLLAKTYAQHGEGQGIAALKDLGRHPATARHLSTKLARHFMGDAPPESAIERLTKTYLDTEGDLAAVSLALVDSPEAWNTRPVKFKPPEDYVISTLRALNTPPLTGRQLIALLQRMGQRPYWPAGPDGWADIEAPWIGADAVWKRVEWADAFGRGYAAANLDPAAVAHEALGPLLSAETLQAVRGAESPAQGLALFLASPDFQRR
jgi:uncharacterized protein (DUF1800 family)